MSLLIKNVLLDGKETSIHVEGNRITGIGVREKADKVIDGRGKAAIPGFVNTHTHAAMTLFRGYSDDLRLREWLEKHIWPKEAKLTEKDVYWGTKLACLEMIKTGTTCFNDNYIHMRGAVKAIDEMGLRAVVSEVFFDFGNKDKAEQEKKKSIQFIKEVKGKKNPRIIPCIGPHSPYTVSLESLRWMREYADKEKLLIHFHLAETEKEVNDYERQHAKKLIPSLEDAGFLGPDLVCAHSVWLDKKDLSLLAKHDVKISHNPVSNMKLASGVMPYEEMKAAGLTVSLGTDGCASNNCLDMFDSMKHAALLQKVHRMDPTAAPSNEVFDMATINGAKALGIDAGGIRKGRLGDIVLIDLKRPELAPNHNLIANLVYSAKGSCADTVICDGKVLMEKGKVLGEEEIIEKASATAEDLFSR